MRLKPMINNTAIMTTSTADGDVGNAEWLAAKA
jgi:hypothetical protein